MLYSYHGANLHTQNREERDRRGEEIKCGKTSSIYQKLVQKKIPKRSLRMLTVRCITFWFQKLKKKK